jgi:CDP-diacylglycerol--glycerol-3-phosphate 3-phosphatidyltransferase
MNLPNKITTGRFALALLLFAYLVHTDTCSGEDPWAPAITGLVFILAVATDALDGHLARKYNMQTDFGRIADPVVDKVIVSGLLIFMSSVAWSRGFIPVWMTVLIISREFLVSGLRGFIEARGVAFPARWDGKLKMILQCCAIPAVFLYRTLDLSLAGEPAWALDGSKWIALGMIWGMFLMTVSSGARYVMAAARVLRQAEDPA